MKENGRYGENYQYVALDSRRVNEVGDLEQRYRGNIKKKQFIVGGGKK